MTLAQAAPAKVVLLSRHECCLCLEAKQVIERVRREIDFEFEEIDVDAHPQLREKYSDQIPVVFINGRKAFKYRVLAAKLRETLRR